jgi:carboxyl-terminal processing protease
MRVRRSARLLGILLLGLPLCGGSLATASSSPLAALVAVEPTRDRARTNQRVFDRVWSEVRRGYYDPALHGVDWDAARARFRPEALAATDDRALYRVLNAMLDLLDDGHAAASPPAAVRREDTRRQPRAVMGLTLMAAEEPDLWTVERVRAGSPAETAGVQVGWRLNSVDGRPWGPDLELQDGRAVHLVMTDEEDRPRETTLTPRLMEGQEPFTASRSRPGVLVLTVEQFDQGLGRWLSAELEGLAPEVDVILDLRANPGGRLDEAEAVLTCFLPQGQAWATRTGRAGRAVVMRASGDCGGRRGPVANDVAVLVDRGSRSAAELTPAALQEAGRGVVVGEKTEGSVLIAQDTDLPDGGRLTLSRANFVTAGGVRLEKRGVTPDIEAPRSVAQRRAGEDPALEAAIAALAHPQEARVGRSASGL